MSCKLVALSPIQFELPDSEQEVTSAQEILLADDDPIASYLFLIDSESDFDIVLTIFTELLDKFANLENWRGAILFVSRYTNSPTPPLDASQGFDDLGPNDRSQIVGRLRALQFFVRMVSSYSWGAFCKDDRIESYRKRADKLPEYFLKLNRQEILAWRKDLTRIYGLVATKLLQGRAIDCRCEIVDPQQSKVPTFFPRIENSNDLLRLLARVHLYGRITPTSDFSTSYAGAKRDKRRYGPIDDLRLPSRCRADIEKLTENTMSVKFPEPFDQSLAADNLRTLLSLLVPIVKFGDKRQIARARLFLFEMLRDLSQLLVKGTAPWASRSKPDGRPLLVLAIKDSSTEVQDIEQKRISEYFKQAFRAAFRKDHLKLYCIEHEASTTELKPGWDKHAWWRDRLLGNKLVDARDHFTGEMKRHSLREFDIILIEAEYQTRFVGPSIIQWLDHALDEYAARPETGDLSRRAAEKEIRSESEARGASGVVTRPQLFVLSRDESAGHSFMCLWLGAQAFASKSRVFGIPALLTMTNVGKCSTVVDTKKLRPNFFAIEGLIPDQRNRLQSRRPEYMVLGDHWDRYWIEQLPKADLHYHIGTSISLAAIVAMAANTAGYCIAGDAMPDGPERPGQRRSIEEVIENVCKIVMMSNLLRRFGQNVHKESQPFEILWSVARFVLQPTDPKTGNIVDNIPPSFGALEQIIRWLVREDRPVRDFEACSILVVAIHVFDRYIACGDDVTNFRAMANDLSEKVAAQWDGFDVIEEGFSDLRPADGTKRLSDTISDILNYLLNRISQNWSDPFTRIRVQTAINGEAYQGRYKYLGRLAGAARKSCRDAFEKICGKFDQLAPQNSKSLQDATWISNALVSFKARKGEFVFGNDDRLIHVFENAPAAAVQQIRNCRTVAISLESVVQIPDRTDERAQRSLQRYLVGSGILGADHLQVPENILLAGIDLVRQNVRDNVVYSEVRCSTTGYTQGGMNYYDATDLLCVGFDLGALLFGGKSRAGRLDLVRKLRRERAEELWGAPSQRWVRTNILLGAKRHKPREIEDVVVLVKHYMERGPETVPQRPRSINGSVETQPEIAPGRWWRRCSVVGFDLSGKESERIDGLRRRVEPLFQACAPITIHAGEAMTADSIWEAVHDLGAQRIGHGLRLRENAELLEHCVRRGICMELCPISNDFTRSSYKTSSC